MFHRTLWFVTLASCQDFVAPPLDVEPDSRLTGEELTATGTEIRGGWQAYQRADLSCTTSGGYGSPSTCVVGFSVAPVEGGGLSITIDSYWPATVYSTIQNAIVGKRFTVGEGAPARGTLPYWTYEIALEGDRLSFDLDSEYGTLSRCSGTRYTTSCEAVFSDPDLGELALPAPRPLSEVGPGEIVVSEIVADPEGCDDEHAEWIELLNLGDARVDLAGLAVVDASGRVSTVEGAPVLELGGRTVLGHGPLDAFCGSGVEPDAGLLGSFGLNNGGDTVRLLAGSQLLDEVTYGAVGGGLAVARDGDGVWCEDVPSPGAEGADCPPVAAVPVADLLPGELRITEAMFDPLLMSDTSGEWIEIQNAGERHVDLAGLRIEDDSENGGSVSGELVLAPGALAVLGRKSGSDWVGAPIQPDGWYGSEPSWNNTGDRIVLANDAGPIDETPLLIPSAGVALQLADGGWCDASSPIGTGGEFGTPGEANPPCG